jgi:hypothetical protein
MEKLFDPIAHKYYIGAREYPGVTTILKRAGFTTPFNEDEDAARFGRIFHDTLALIFQKRLEKIDETFAPWMTGIDKFMSEQKPVPYISSERSVERIMISEKQGYAGTMDLAGQINHFSFRGRWPPCFLDWKTWSTANKHEVALAGLQLAGYDKLYREFEHIPSFKKIPRAVVHFTKTDYRIYPCDDPADFSTFQAALICNQWKQRFLSERKPNDRS